MNDPFLWIWASIMILFIGVMYFARVKQEQSIDSLHQTSGDVSKYADAGTAHECRVYGSFEQHTEYGFVVCSVWVNNLGIGLSRPPDAYRERLTGWWKGGRPAFPYDPIFIRWTDIHVRQERFLWFKRIRFDVPSGKTYFSLKEEDAKRLFADAGYFPEFSAPTNISTSRVVTVIIAMGAASLLAFHYISSYRAHSYENLELHISAAAKAAQPLIDAIEQYRTRNGSYPPTLESLGRLAGVKRDGLRYSVNELERVLKGGDCANREREISRSTFGPAAFERLQAEKARFEQDCIAGYKSYKLQSENFPPKYKFEPTQRWARFDSRSGQWTLGWSDN